MSYRLTEGERKHFAAIEDTLLEIIKQDNNPEKLWLRLTDGDHLGREDPPTQGPTTIPLSHLKLNQRISGNILELKDIVYLSETTLSDYGWKFRISGVFEGEYLKNIQLIRVNDTDFDENNQWLGPNYAERAHAVISGDVALEKLVKLIVSGNLDVGGDTSISGDLDVLGNTTFQDLEVKGTLDVSGKATFKDDVTISKKATISGLLVQNDADINGNLIVTNNLTVLSTGSGIFNGGVTINNEDLVLEGADIRGEYAFFNNDVSANNITAKNNLIAISGISGDNLTINNLIKTTDITASNKISGSSGVFDYLTVNKKSALNGDTTISGVFLVKNDINLSGNLYSSGSADISGDLSISGNAAVTKKLSVKTGADISGTTELQTLKVSETTTLSGNVTAKSNIYIGQNEHISGTLTVSGQTTVSGLTVQQHATISGLLVQNNAIISGLTASGLAVTQNATISDLTVTYQTKTSGLLVDHNAVVSSGLETSGLFVKSQATISGLETSGLLVKNKAVISGLETSGLLVEDEANIDQLKVSGLLVYTNSTLGGTTNISGTTTISGNTTLFGTSTISGTTTIRGVDPTDKDEKVTTLQNLVDPINDNDAVPLWYVDNIKAKLEKNVTAELNVGGIVAGDILSEGLTFTEFVIKLLSYKPPEITYFGIIDDGSDNYFVDDEYIFKLEAKVKPGKNSYTIDAFSGITDEQPFDSKTIYDTTNESTFISKEFRLKNNFIGKIVVTDLQANNKKYVVSGLFNQFENKNTPIISNFKVFLKDNPNTIIKGNTYTIDRFEVEIETIGSEGDTLASIGLNIKIEDTLIEDTIEIKNNSSTNLNYDVTINNNKLTIKPKTSLQVKDTFEAELTITNAPDGEKSAMLKDTIEFDNYVAPVIKSLTGNYGEKLNSLTFVMEKEGSNGFDVVSVTKNNSDDITADFDTDYTVVVGESKTYKLTPKDKIILNSGNIITLTIDDKIQTGKAITADWTYTIGITPAGDPIYYGTLQRGNGVYVRDGFTTKYIDEIMASNSYDSSKGFRNRTFTFNIIGVAGRSMFIAIPTNQITGIYSSGSFKQTGTETDVGMTGISDVNTSSPLGGSGPYSIKINNIEYTIFIGPDIPEDESFGIEII